MGSEQISSFSHRLGYSAQEITIREDAPLALRVCVLNNACNYQTTRPILGALSLRDLRSTVCRVLNIPLDDESESDNQIWQETKSKLLSCPWFKVYNVIEGLHAAFKGRRASWTFADRVNACFVEEGIGWQIVDGLVVTRGSEAFEQAVTAALPELQADSRSTTASAIHEALKALSGRPEADLRVAIYYGIGALECIVRDLVGDQKVTLGEALKKYPNLLPKPVSQALEKLWGHASNEARHFLEGQEFNRDDAEFIVGLAASVCTYLTRKNRPK